MAVEVAPSLISDACPISIISPSSLCLPCLLLSPLLPPISPASSVCVISPKQHNVTWHDSTATLHHTSSKTRTLNLRADDCRMFISFFCQNYRLRCLPFYRHRFHGVPSMTPCVAGRVFGDPEALHHGVGPSTENTQQPNGHEKEKKRKKQTNKKNKDYEYVIRVATPRLR